MNFGERAYAQKSIFLLYLRLNPRYIHRHVLCLLAASLLSAARRRRIQCSWKGYIRIDLDRTSGRMCTSLKDSRSTRKGIVLVKGVVFWYGRHKLIFPSLERLPLDGDGEWRFRSFARLESRSSDRVWSHMMR